MHARIQLLYIVLFSSPLLAQDSGPPPFQLDRPDQTECPFIVPAGYFQMENGISYEQTDAHLRSFVHPTTLWKYGLNENAEFRLITEFTTIQYDSSSLSGLLPVTLGFKVRIAEEKGIRPKTSFIGHLTVPTFASKDLQATYFAPAFRFTMQHTLSERFALAYNLGAEWDGETAVPVFIYTLTTGFALTEKAGLYAEVFGFIPTEGDADHRFDCGMSYLFAPGFIMDLSGGARITENAPQYYVALGFSFRFKAR